METVAANIWQKSKLLVKGLLIGGLILLLLIPSYFVQEIIREREARQKEAFTEISGKWAGRQDITGPVLVLPYTETVTSDKGQVVSFKKLAYVLPDNLRIESIVKPEERHRGIYQVMLYSAQV
ncbi:MAG TPA: inner membrane CreD family protein, partial [Chitinophagaceae bacterium]|nr:inner membrane CreD family protein [Chitinophagaceae bacterium]